MSIEKQTAVDVVEILESGVVQVRTVTRIVEDGKVISQTFHRHLVEPGQDYSQETQRLKTVCAAIHTPEVVAAYKASMPKGE